MISKENIKQIAEKYGSPFFLINENKIKDNIDLFNNSFSNYKGKFTLGYSVKTNPLVGILKIMRKYGVASECASSIDIESSLAAGYKYSDIVYAGLFKSHDTLRNSVENEIKLINIESFQEAEELYKICKQKNKKIKVGIRIAFPSKTGIKSMMGITYDRFGNSLKMGEAFKVADFLAERNDCFEIVGLHCHPGSNIKSSKIYKVAIDKLIEVYEYLIKKHNINVNLINIGGGVGIKDVKFYSMFDYGFSTLYKIFGKKYNISDKNFSEKKVLDEVVEYLNKKFSTKKSFPDIMMEPGRALVGNALDIYSSVVLEKKTESGNWLIIDAGTNILSILTLLTEQHEILTSSNEKQKRIYSIAGPLLYSSDIIARNLELNLTKEKDYISIKSVGAYFGSQSSNFLFPRCANVLKTNSGEYELIERQETTDDVLLRSTNL